MNYIPFIVMLVITLVYFLSFSTMNKSHDSRDFHIDQVMKKYNYQVSKTELVPFFAQDNPFSYITFSNKNCDIYRIFYTNINNEEKIAYVKFKGFSSTGKWKGL